MKRLITITTLALLLLSNNLFAQSYTPSEANLKAREEFRDNAFGIFIHWGLYSMLGSAEWVMNNRQISKYDYQMLAEGFYPSKFNAKEWVSAFKDAGARYICITSRHHDGFSMFKSEHTKYNIVDASPYGRDVLKELADECHKQGLKIHFYYSHADWYRDDYPLGSTGHSSGRKSEPNWNNYYQFMNNQLTELLTNYGPVGAIWFDGFWDQDGSFDWRAEEQYSMIHSLQDACLIANNHHGAIIPGEDIQVFERDLPGENTAGYSPNQKVGRLPLESCMTMNDNWGYDINDHNYKSLKEIIQTLVKASGFNGNLLLNIGPQPNGEIPADALGRLKEIGEWNRKYGETVFGTRATIMPAQNWGVATQKGNKTYIHILNHSESSLLVPITDIKVRKVSLFEDGTKINFKKTKEGLVLNFPEIPSGIDYIVVIES